MATITLRTQHKEIACYKLDKNKVTQIGRLSENDIVIDAITVSGKHAQIIADDMGFMIEDLASRNGTFIDGKPVKSRRLTEGNVITIGKHELCYSDQDVHTGDISPVGDVPPIQSTTDSATVFLDTQKQKEMIDKHDRLGKEVPLLVVTHKGRMLYKYLFKRETTEIGRGQQNRIIIDNPIVSSQHAKITRNDSEFIISDLNSKNGTFVNKKKITTHTLTDGDVIGIGQHELRFEQSGTFIYDEVGQPFSNYAQTLSSTDGTLFLNTQEASVPFPAGLTYLKGGNGYIPIQKQITRLGKDAASDISVKGLLVGSTAAMIIAKSDGYYLRYQNGCMKPAVNGVRVTDSVKLNDGDIIKVGSVRFEFKIE